MTSDKNKNITSIAYNHLNLPVRIVFGGDLNTRVDYAYDALGAKLQKTVVQYNPIGDHSIVLTSVTDYLGFQYKDGVLQFFPTSEGYVSHTKGSYSYVYNYTDHLGNVRMSYADNGLGTVRVLEENHYYPFGMKHANYNSDELEFQSRAGAVVLRAAPTNPGVVLNYDYKFNGQEWQDELGLNTTAMDYRQYDNATGRFNGIDALAEMQYSQTPYHFGYGNPVFWADPSGLLSDSFLQSLWDNSNNSSGATTWNNHGGIFASSSSSSSTGFAGIDDNGTFYDNLMNPVTVVSGSAEGGIIIQNHVYSNSSLPNFSSTLSFASGLAGLYTDIRWSNTLDIAKQGKFIHTNGKIYSQNYYGGRWHAASNIKASKLKFNSGVKLIGKISTGLAVVGAVATIYDGATNKEGWKGHHTADLIISGGLYILAASNPLGWIAGGAYFIADMGVQAYTGKSITENLFDN